jgi:hypothetical protein
MTRKPWGIRRVLAIDASSRTGVYSAKERLRTIKKLRIQANALLSSRRAKIRGWYSHNDYSPSLQVIRIHPSYQSMDVFRQTQPYLRYCVPHPAFFPYCAILPEAYRYATRDWCISGSNFQNGRWRWDGSYYYSDYPHCLE